MTTIESRTAPPRATQQPDTKTQPRPKTRPSTRPKATQKAGTASKAAGRPRTPFVLLVLCLLGGALVSLLLLNTVLARDAYTLTALESNVRKLEQQKQALKENNLREAAPPQVAQKARNLGMVQPTQPAFIDPSNGTVTGPTLRPVPSPAAAAAAAAGVIGVPGAVVPGDGIPGWTGTPAPSGSAGSDTPAAP